MTQEQLLQAANPSLMKAFFLLNELKRIYYANLTDLGKKEEINFEKWTNDFIGAYKDMWCEFENLWGAILQVDIDKIA